MEDCILAIVEYSDDATPEIRYVREPFRRQPDFEVTSVNSDLGELKARGTPPSWQTSARSPQEKPVYLNVNSMLEYHGARLTIRYCEEPPAGVDSYSWVPRSWQEALAHIRAKERDGIAAKMVARRTFLADTGQLRSPDHWNTEGELPSGKRFYAVKADKIRAYGWFLESDRGVFWISHFAFKKGQKVARADANRLIDNWRRIEGQ